MVGKPDRKEHVQPRSYGSCVWITGWAPDGGEAEKHRSDHDFQDSFADPLRGGSPNATTPHAPSFPF